MTVHQVEEYYVSINISATTEKDIARVRKILDDNNWDDLNINKDYMIIEGFESEMDASNCEEIIQGCLDE